MDRSTFPQSARTIRRSIQLLSSRLRARASFGQGRTLATMQTSTLRGVAGLDTLRQSSGTTLLARATCVHATTTRTTDEGESGAASMRTGLLRVVALSEKAHDEETRNRDDGAHRPCHVRSVQRATNGHAQRKGRPAGKGAGSRRRQGLPSLIVQPCGCAPENAQPSKRKVAVPFWDGPRTFPHWPLDIRGLV